MARQIGEEDAAREALAHSAEDIFGFVCVRACVHVCVCASVRVVSFVVQPLEQRRRRLRVRVGRKGVRNKCP